MAVQKSKELEKEAVETGASMMALAVRTAPKTRGIDLVKTAVLTGADLEPLARAMEKKAGEKSTDLPIFKRDADSGIYTSPWGVRIKDTVLVGKEGLIVLTDYPHSLQPT